MLSQVSSVLRASPPPSAIIGKLILLGLPKFIRFPYYARHPILHRTALQVLIVVSSLQVAGFAPYRRLATIDLLLRCLTGFICITAYIVAGHELSTVCFRPAPHDCFKLNDKLACVILSYYWVIIYKRTPQGVPECPQSFLFRQMSSAEWCCAHGVTNGSAISQVTNQAQVME